MRKKQWRTRTKGTKKQVGKKFLVGSRKKVRTSLLASKNVPAFRRKEIDPTSSTGSILSSKDIPDSPDVVGEEKYDGSKYLMQILPQGNLMTSRKISVKTKRHVEKGSNIPHITGNEYPSLYGTVLEGEVVHNKGFSAVNSIMLSKPERAVVFQKVHGNATYVVYDILYYKGKDVRTLPLRERRKILGEIFKSKVFPKHVKLSKIHKGKAKIVALFNYLTKKLKKEGVMVKNLSKPYGEHLLKWKKIRTFDGIVDDYVYGRGKYTNTVGSLIVKQYVEGDKKPREVATISGMTDAQRKEFKKKLDAGKKFIVEFEAQEITKHGRYRHPRFVRVRYDKKFSDCKFGK